jgi:CHAT domain-containing protein
MFPATGRPTRRNESANRATLHPIPRHCVAASVLLAVLCMATCSPHNRISLKDLYQHAQLLNRQDDLTQALVVSSQGLKRAWAEHDTDYYWRFRLLKAEVLLVRQDLPAASKLIEGTIPPSLDTGDLHARQWMDRGRLELSTGEAEKSLLAFERAEPLARKAGNQSLVAEIELRRGSSLLRLGKASAAEAAFRAGLKLARRQDDAFLEASAFGDLAALLLNDARYDEAIDQFQQALIDFEKIPSLRSIPRTLNNLGLCELQLGDPQKAIGLFQEANRRAKATTMGSDQEVSLGRIGDCYRTLGNQQRALAFYQEALEIARRTRDRYWIATWLNNLATTSIDLGDLQQAELYNRQAREAQQQQTTNPLERLYPLLNEARIAALRKQFGRAESEYRSIISSAQVQPGIRDPSITLEARSGLARLLAEEGHPAEAESQWKATLALIDSTRSEVSDVEHRLTYLSSLIRFYQDYVEFLSSQGRDTEAMLVAESSRARVLEEQLQGSDRPPPPVTLARLQVLARRSHAIFLSYWLAPRRSFLWVIRPVGLTTFALPGEARITQDVQRYRREIDDLRDPLAVGSPAGRALYETLIAPAQSLIPEGARVAIAPDGALYNLNFDTIPIPKPRPHYWIEDVTVSVMPSMSAVMARTRFAEAQPPSLLLIGDPVSAEVGFPPLRHAKSEIEAIRKQFGSACKVVLTGSSAQPDAYAQSRPERFSFIHFTAHATANPRDPLDSAIILSPHGDDFKLYVRDVAHVPIHADLVTLSACRSAGEHAYAGEGLVGFAWAFLRAGARRVIASLWEVDDRSTGQLMTRLYADLRRGSIPADALREAQLQMLNSRSAYHKPYYWAAFEVFADSLSPRTPWLSGFRSRTAAIQNSEACTCDAPVRHAATVR